MNSSIFGAITSLMRIKNISNDESFQIIMSAMIAFEEEMTNMSASREGE